MRLYVYVLEAQGLPPSRGSCGGAYVKLRIGKHNSRTRTEKDKHDRGHAVWNEEFVFRLEVEEAEGTDLEVSVFDARRGEAFGSARVPLLRLGSGDGPRAMPPRWFPLCPYPRASSKSGEIDSGKILLTVTLYGDTCSHEASSHFKSFSDITSVGDMADAAGLLLNVPEEPPSPTMTSRDRPISERMQHKQALAGRWIQRLFSKNEEDIRPSSRNKDSSELSGELIYDVKTEGTFPGVSFEEALEIIQSKDESEMPDNLQGGILLDQKYAVDPKDLNLILFEPESQFRRDIAQQEGTTGYQEGPWTWAGNDQMSLRRTVTYIKAANKFVKAVKATEEQIYLKADGKNFSVLTRVVTPDVPCGNCFEIDLLCRIMPGPILSSGESCSQLVISLNIIFHQSTLMRSMIEGRARQGIKESYEKFADLLSQNIRPVESAELLDKEQCLNPLQLDHRSDWEMAMDYFCNFTLFSFLLMGLYVLLHILLSKLGIIQRLEIDGLDLPDSFSEMITCGILVLQGERVYNMFMHFVQARIQRGSDHGVKAQGDGWLLTVALIEASNLNLATPSGFADPYVVFSCNGKTRTSSVQLQTNDPRWNEILEFDAMLEPPAVLDVEVFNFDGPFGMAISLGHAKVNFLKHSPEELADLWIPLEGKVAQFSHSQLHLRIFLENTKGVETIREYLTKMEKEVGKKLNLRSPHKNSTFQKLFGLPPDEFLINEFSCYLKRKMPLQGRIFLSARIVGFYANFLGHKAKFFFLWEDIEDVEVLPPSLGTVGSPALLIILKTGRGLDARHGAKSLDEDGRLKFQFQSFASFSSASRIIMALWRTRTLVFEQEARLQEDHSSQGGKSLQAENVESVRSSEDNNLSKSFFTEIRLPLPLLMEIFDGGHTEKKTMEKAERLGYLATQWESVGPDAFERHISYKFSRQMSIFGGEVSSRQQKTPIGDGDGWIIDEVMTIHNVPFADHFQVHIRYKISSLASSFIGCRYEVSVGVIWMKGNKGSKFRKRITRNICDKLIHRLKEIFDLAKSEILTAKSLGDVS